MGSIDPTTCYVASPLVSTILKVICVILLSWLLINPFLICLRLSLLREKNINVGLSGFCMFYLEQIDVTYVLDGPMRNWLLRPNLPRMT